VFVTCSRHQLACSQQRSPNKLTTKTLSTLRHRPSLILLDLCKSRPIKLLASLSDQIVNSKTYSSAASFSNLLICSLASLTATFAEANARSASLSAASAFITLSLAAIIVGSSSRLCKSPLRRGDPELLVWVECLVSRVFVVSAGETSRLRPKRVERRLGGSTSLSWTGVSSWREKRGILILGDLGTWLAAGSGFGGVLVFCNGKVFKDGESLGSSLGKREFVERDGRDIEVTWGA
jgi:hypothetical protein